LIRQWAADSKTLTFFPVEEGAEVPLPAYPLPEPLVKQVALLTYLVLIRRLCHWLVLLELVPSSFLFYIAPTRKPYAPESHSPKCFPLFAIHQEVEQTPHLHPHP